MKKDVALSEPEGDYSDLSSYEELPSISDNDNDQDEEFILSDDYCNENRRRSTCSSNYRSWHLKRRGSKISSDSLTTSSSSKEESLTTLTDSRKNWWYWIKLATFVASPFVARQLGIIVGKRILGRAFKSAVPI